MKGFIGTFQIVKKRMNKNIQTAITASNHSNSYTEGDVDSNFQVTDMTPKWAESLNYPFYRHPHYMVIPNPPLLTRLF